MFSVTTESNYLAQIVKLEKSKQHPNADRLQIWNVNGYDVITDMSSKEGDIKIFFPVECQIHHKILSKMNMYQDRELNEDQTKVGYISKSRRVKAVKLRGMISDGILLPLKDVCIALDVPEERCAYCIDEKFDTLDGIVICNKYVPEIKEVRSGQGQGKPKGPKISDILIPGQFNFHYSTSKLQDNVWRFNNPENTIVITDKWHGTSAVFSNLLTKRKLSIWEKIKMFFGSNVSTEEYKKMYSSRTVIKHVEDRYHTKEQGFYNSDIWGKVFEDVKPCLFEGYTIYGEIVGYTGEKMIQKGYGYGCLPGQYKFLIYRITSQEPYGLLEWSWNDIKLFCEEYNLNHVPELYYGKIGDFINQSSKGEFDSVELLQILKDMYLEKDCRYCTHSVPAEGICIRNESTSKIAYKLKSKRFLEWESKQLDTGEEIIE